ncbi:MAG TPA: hypothetical protein VN823_14110 [Stellaceae bacterium]|nr:hypothetical protein [Stellaceae bacterium]
MLDAFYRIHRVLIALRRVGDSAVWAALPLAIGISALPGTAGAVDIFNNSNTDAVLDCPAPGAACDPSFTVAAPTVIGQVSTYHWHGGQGETPGRVQIGIKTPSGQVLGPFRATGTPATNGVLANWTVTFNRRLPPGQYSVIDTRPETWSQNARSNDKGFAIVSGTPAAGGGGASPSPRPGTTPPRPPAAPPPVACTFRNGFQFLCFGDVITLSSNPIVAGGMLTLTVNPASGYSFDASTVLVLEPTSGVGFGVGLLTLCGGLVGGAAAPACPFTAPKTMTLPIPGGGPIPAGTYILRAENWNPSVVVGGVGICTPTCTEADAGIVQFATAPPSTLQITNVFYPGPNGQIAVQFVDPPQSVNQIQVRPWTGYQWGQPISWNPGAAGLAGGTLFIQVGGCTPGQSYTIFITLFDAMSQQAQQKFTYVCR